MRRFWGPASATNVWRHVVAVLVPVLAIAVVAASARAQTPTRSDTVFGLRLPAHIGGADRDGVRDYETTQPGLGFGANYRMPGWTIDLYVYDLKLSSIPDDTSSTVFKEALTQAKEEVFGLGRRGDYKSVVLKSDFTILDAAGRTRFVCAQFSFYRVQFKVDVDSYLCMTAWKGRFVKFRLTTARNDASSAVSRRFVEAWSGVLWPQS